MKKKFLTVLTSAGVTAATVAALASCGNKNTTPTTTTTETTTSNVDPEVEVADLNDFLYCSTEVGDAFVTFSGDKVTVFVDGATYTGTIAKNGNAYTFSFKNTTIGVVQTANGYQLKIDQDTYNLLTREGYEVTFVDGETTVKTVKVVNGKAVDEIAAPEKDGYAFVGWYADENFEVEYDFANTPVFEATTIYARYVSLEVGKTEYTVTVVNGDSTTTISTTNGVAYNLPLINDEAFLGWYVAVDGDATKLAYQYAGQELTENTTLVAVYNQGELIVTVDDNKISWNEIKGATQYSITIKDENDEIVREATETLTSYTYNFEQDPAGVYTIVVGAADKIGTAYKKNKILDKVTNFNFVDNYLVFEPVANATRYDIYVECGNELHDHDPYNLGTNTFFDFSECEMKKGGIKFTVVAYAAGYKSSVSKEIVLDRTLEAVSAKVVDDQLVWNRLNNAMNYVVEVTSGDVTETFEVGNTNSFDLRYYSGELSLTVYAVRDGYYSTKTVVEYTKETLAAPVNVHLDRTVLAWDAVAGAASYVVVVGGQAYPVDTTSLEITSDMVAGLSSFTYSVQAIAEDAAKNSDYTYEAVVNRTLGDIEYVDGVLVWDEVFGASKYGVKVNDGKEVNYTANSCPLTLTKAGVNTIAVCFYDANGARYYDKTITVVAKEIMFALEDETVCPSSLYYALGDTVTLPEASREGYYFEGWYTLPNATEQGGVQIKDGFKMPNKNIILYPNWESMPVQVTLEAGAKGTLADEDKTKEVRFGKSFTLAVPEMTDDGYVFVGWYSQPNGDGVRVTDETGKGLLNWMFAADTTLYPNYQNIVSYEVIEVNSQQVVEVVAGPGIKYAKEITVPATVEVKVDGALQTLPVYQLGAFKAADVKNVTKINVPDTIKVLDYELALKAFEYLVELNVYDADPADDYTSIYASQDGILYVNDPLSDVHGFEIAYIPAKNGTVYNILNILEGTVRIGDAKVKGLYKYTKVVIPDSVTYIGKEAFSGCYGLLTVEFAPSTEESLELTIDEKAFNGLSNLTYITLPARLANLDSTALVSCSKLANIYVEEGSTVYQSKDGMLCTNNGTDLIYCPKGREGEITIPEGVSTIKKEAFKSDTKLTKVTIPGHVTTIEESAFESCSGLLEVEFTGEAEDAALSIGERAFYSCTKLESITLGANVRNIEAHAFGGITKLVEVTVNATGKIKYAEGITQYDTTNGISYVATVNIGKDTEAFDIVGAFGSTSDKLKEINVDPENENYTSEEGVLFDKKVTTILFYPASDRTEYSLPITVTKIGAGIFNKRTALEKFTIGKQITEIGDNAFYGCSNITDLIFEEGRTEPLTIGAQAFRNCTKLAAINLPSATITVEEEEKYVGVTTIGDLAFANCNALTEVVIPEGVTKVGDQVFMTDKALTKITIPASLVEFGTFNVTNPNTRISMLDYCSGLKEIEIAEKHPYFTAQNGMIMLKDAETGYGTELLLCAVEGDVVIPKTVAVIRDRVFYDNDTITSICFEDNMSAATKDADGNWVQGVLTVGTSTNSGVYVYYKKTPTATTLTSDTKQPVTNAFYSCSELVSVSLPGLVEMPTRMFSFCSKLTTFEIPNTVKKIGLQVFNACTSYKTLTFQEGNDDNLLEVADGLVYTSSPGNGAPTYTTWTSFGAGSYEKVILPKRCHTVSPYEFSYNENLKEVVFPETFEAISDHMFYNSKSLEIADISNTKITSIGEDGFYYTKLSSITFPETLVSIGKYAFGYTNIESLTLSKAVTTLADSTFMSMSKLKSVNFEEGSVITAIPSSCFSGVKSLETVSIPASVKTIGASAFYNCSALKTVTWEGTNVSSIGNSAFYGTGLEEFTFPLYKNADGKIDKLTLGTTLFATNKNLTTVHLSQSVAGFDNVFNNAPNITAMDILPVEEGAEFADGYTFNYAVSEDNYMILTKDLSKICYIFRELPKEYTLPSTLVEISPLAFQKQYTLESITIPKTVVKVGNQAFSQCLALKSVVFEAGSPITVPSVTDATTKETETFFGAQVFEQCASLESVTLPSGLTALPKRTFYRCASLKTINLPSTIESIGEYAFTGCVELTSIKLPDVCATVNGYAFQYCYKLSSVNLDKVTSIGAFAFNKCSALKSVTLSSSLTKLLGNSFSYTAIEEITLPGSLVTTTGSEFIGCTSLKEVTFEEGITKLGGTSFSGCTSLTTINWPSTIPNLDGAGSLFLNCTSLKKVTLPDDMATIPSSMFSGCTSLEEITIPNSVKNIADAAFKGCESLTAVTLPSSLVQLGNATGTSVTKNCQTFANCTSLQSVTFTGAGTSAYYVNMNAFLNCTSLLSVVFTPKANVGTNLFEGCTALTTIDLTNTNVSSSVGGSMFKNCTALSEVILPTTANGIAASMFLNCTSLKSISLPAKCVTLSANCFEGSGLETIDCSKVTKFNAKIFLNCTSLTSIVFPTVTCTYADDMFAGCTSMTLETMMANKATTIGISTFEGRDDIEEVVIPATITKINKYAFRNCKNLKKVTFLGTKCTTIDESAFEGCTALTDFVIPSSVTTINKFAFKDCGFTGTFTIPKTVTSLNNNPFAGVMANIVVEEGSTKFYNDETTGAVVSTATTPVIICLPANSTLEEISIPAGVKVGAYAAYGCENLKKIVCDPSVTLTASAFANCGVEEITCPTTLINNMVDGCENLKKVTFSEATTAIPASTFVNCGLEEIVLPETITNIGNQAFQNCQLQSITVPATVTKIGLKAFADNHALTTVTFTEGVLDMASMGTGVNISQNWFYECENLTTVNLSDNVTTLACGMYSYSGIANVVLPKSVTTIPASCYAYCPNITNVVIPSTVETISASAFMNSSLESIVIPENVTTIGSKAFSFTKLKSLVVPAGVTKLESSLVAGCEELETIEVKGKITNIYGFVFDTCPALKKVYLDTSEVISVASNVFKNTTATLYITTKLARLYAFASDFIGAGAELTIVENYVPEE